MLQLDTSADGFVDWNEFVTYMLLQLKERDQIKVKTRIPFRTDPRIRHVVHNRVCILFFAVYLKLFYRMGLTAVNPRFPHGDNNSPRKDANLLNLYFFAGESTQNFSV